MNLVTTSVCTSYSCCMKSRRYHFMNRTICVIVFTIIIGLWLCIYFQVKSKDINNESFVRRYFSGFNHNSSFLASRAGHLNQKCESLSLNTSNVKSRLPIFFLSEVNGLAVCKTPKTGSTFMGTIIRALTAPRDSDVKKIFQLERNTIHDGKNEKPKTAVFKKDPLAVLVTRDPYSRLFSAYVDKYLLLGQLGRELTIYLKRGFKEVEDSFCGYDVSFQDFLDYVFHLIETGSEVNEHFVPITVLCDLCKIKYHMVLKQESLTNDVRETLVIIKNLTSNRVTSIQHSLNTTSFYDSIHSLVLSFMLEYKYYNSDCPKSIHFMEKIWRSFQIQGLVSDKLNFPREALEKFSFADNEAGEITSVMVKIASYLPLSYEERQRQRRDALARAYKNITPDTIAKIQTVFKMDFDLFDYSNSPPIV